MGMMFTLVAQVASMHMLSLLQRYYVCSKKWSERVVNTNLIVWVYVWSIR